MKKLSKLALLLLALILFLGFFLRVQETLTGNYLFLLDQGRDLLAVKKIVFEHRLTLIGPYTSLGGVFQGPLWYYLLAIPTFILRGDPWGSLVLMLIISMTVLIVVFCFMRKYFGIVPALLTTYLFAISPEAAAAATYSWNPHPVWLIIVLYIHALYLVVSGRQKTQLLLWPLIGLCFHFQTAFGVFLLAATLLYFLVAGRDLCRTKYFSGGLVLMLVCFIPQIWFELRHNFLMTRSVLKIFAGSNQGLFVQNESQGYFNLVKSHLFTFLANFNSAFFQDKFLYYLPRFALPLMILSTLVFHQRKLFERRERILIKITASIVFLIIGLSFFYPFPLRYWFLTGFQSFYLVLLGLILAKYYSFPKLRIFIYLLILATGLSALQRLNVLYFNPPDDGGGAKIKGKLAAIDYIYRDADSKPFSLFIFTPPVNTDAFDYLIWWYGRKKYHYLPNQEKKGLFYLLIEPDSARPWTYQGWLETVIVEGKILATQTLPSGLIVQKRYLSE